MKKLYCFIFTFLLVFQIIPGFSQGFMLKSEISPVRDIYDSRFAVDATVMDNDSWCRLTWPVMIGYYPEVWYDDDEADDFFLYSSAGNMNAIKFTPYHENYMVTGGRIYVGDGAFPGPFLGTSFRVLVYDDDGEGGIPGTVLDSTEVIVDNYEWVEFEGLTVTIAEGSFYLAMKQTAPAPNAAPIGVDLDNPTYFNSYCYFVGATGWVLSPLQDFMIRAWIYAYNEPSREPDYFELARFSNFNPNGSPLLGDTTYLDSIFFSEYDDYAWDSLPAGLYAYGVKTHFTGGEWSDYDVSNIVTHIMNCYPPSCFYQAVIGTPPLIICPPADSTGAIPSSFIGYNLYKNDELVAFLPPSSTNYLPDCPLPCKLNYGLTALYDLTSYGYPGETGESIPLITGYIARWGFELPFLEQWNLGTFETNNWIADGPNWSITGQEGNPAPSAEFTWDPVQTDYSISLESYPFQADSMTEGQIYLDFDIKLDNFNPTGTEQMLAQVWNWENQSWATVNTYSNENGSFGWVSEHLDITDQAMQTVFKIRFTAQGEYSVNILSWFVDNIHVYRACLPPLELTVEVNWQLEGFELNWEPPEVSWIDEWIHWDDGVNSGNSIGTGEAAEFDVAARWEPAQLAMYEGASVTEIGFFPAEAASTYKVRVWVGAGAANLVVDQPVGATIIGQWNYVTLTTPIPIDVTQELWVGYYVNTTTGFPAGVDDGPANDSYGNMMNFDGWQTLLEINPELDFNWNISAHIETVDKKKPKSEDSILKYAVYRNDDGTGYFLLDYTYEETYFDNEPCGYGNVYCYQVTAQYFSNIDSCESEPSNESCFLCWFNIDEPSAFDLKIYPNPVSDFLFIEAIEKIESIIIFDSRGITQERWNAGTLEHLNNGTVAIPVNELVPGLYLVRVETGGGVVGKKVVIR